jgi:ubiquinone/menaquinone biosynthesis C-methylase UbiE
MASPGLPARVVETRLFAEAGYDPWMVDFEPNSLWLGGLYAHPSMGPGKRVVADASLMPFGDGTFDIALVKEFAHHVDDKDRLFAEVNRVLRHGGMLVLIDCTSTSRAATATWSRWPARTSR